MKRFTLISVLCICGMLLCACSVGKKPTNQQAQIEQEQPELKQNDYRGGVFRTNALKTNIITVIEDMKQNNALLRSSAPDSYWTEEGYQDFVLNFLSTPIIMDTRWMNEEQTTFEAAVSGMLSNENSFTKKNSDGFVSRYDGLSIVRNEKDDYSITGVTEPYIRNNLRNSGSTSYRILYDCDKDWCKAYATFAFSNDDLPNFTRELFEYRRVNADSFLIQTSTERLYVTLGPGAEGATSIAKRPVKAVYYSKLSGGSRTTYEPYEPLSEYDDEGRIIDENRQKNRLYQKNDYLNEEGDLSFAYGKKDSQFLKGSLALTDPIAWVFEDKALAQGIIYENNVLVVVTFNKLSESYERFIYVKGTINEAEIERISSEIVIEGLVGFNENGEPKTEEEEPDDTNTPDEIVEPTSEPTPESVPEETGGGQE